MASTTGLALDRCFKILEIFSQEQRPMRAAELQEALDCPRSSLTILLRGLIEQGYIHYDQRQRSYFPSLKVQSLGDWILSTLTRGPQLQRIALDLRNKAEETAVVSVKAGNYLEVAVVETGSQPISLQLPISTRFPLWNTAVGTAYFMAQKDADIAKSYHQDGAQHDGAASLDDIFEAVSKARRRGYAIAFGSVIADLAALACPLQLGDSGPITVLSVGGPIRRIKADRNRLADLLTNSAAKAQLLFSKPNNPTAGEQIYKRNSYSERQ